VPPNFWLLAVLYLPWALLHQFLLNAMFAANMVELLAGAGIGVRTRTAVTVGVTAALFGMVHLPGSGRGRNPPDEIAGLRDGHRPALANIFRQNLTGMHTHCRSCRSCRSFESSPKSGTGIRLSLNTNRVLGARNETSATSATSAIWHLGMTPQGWEKPPASPWPARYDLRP